MRRRSAVVWFGLAAAALLVAAVLPPSPAPVAGAPRGLAALLLQFRPLMAELLFEDLIVRSASQDASALDRARRVLELEPGSEELRFQVAFQLGFTVSLREAGTDRRALWVRAAADLLKEGLERYPDSALLHFGLGLLQKEKPFGFAGGDAVLQDAAQHLVRAAELGGDPTYALYATGAVRLLALGVASDESARAAALAQRLLGSRSWRALDAAGAGPDADMRNPRADLEAVIELARIAERLAAPLASPPREQLEQRRKALTDQLRRGEE